MSSGRTAAAAALAAVGLGFAFPAAADPPPDPAPVTITPGAPPPPPPPNGIFNSLAQSGQPTGLLGLPDLSAYATNVILGQNPVPAAPGSSDPATIPNLHAFNPEYLLAQNTAPAAPGEGALAPGIGPVPDDPGTGRIAFLKRLHEMYSSGALKGSFLGQMSPEEFDALYALPAPTS